MLFIKNAKATVRKKQLSTSVETAKIKGDLLKLQEELKKKTEEAG